MDPFDSVGDMYRRVASQLEPAPKYEANSDTTATVVDAQGIDDLVVVSVDGSWIPEFELMRQGFEVVRTTSHREIERSIDAVVGPEQIKRST